MFESLLTSFGLLGLLIALWLGILWPFFFLYGFFSALKSLRRIASALEHQAYDTPRQVVHVAPEPKMATETREPHIGLSAFGR